MLLLLLLLLRFTKISLGQLWDRMASVFKLNLGYVCRWMCSDRGYHRSNRHLPARYCPGATDNRFVRRPPTDY